MMNKKKLKKKYIKPTVTKVELKPEEAALTGCKAEVVCRGKNHPVRTMRS
jgi:hypothetical protein